ncbi:MAG TPA: hypothetical protein PLT66_06630 [Bacillota bacterium]|nr:hypothetical protein [Bacillota bacterium]
MIKITPIPELKEKREYAGICGCADRLSPDALTYGIISEEKKIGLCQFRLTDEGGEILLLRPVPGTNDPQSLILALRGALFFMDNAGIKRARFLDDDDTVARAVGFSDRALSLEGFFEKKCGTSANGVI